MENLSVRNIVKSFEAAVNYRKTVWKFQYFSVTQILREINFGESRSSKNAVLPFKGL